jgi:hypothetical protein
VCWEAANWKYNNKEASSETLETLPLKLDDFWRDWVLAVESFFPRIIVVVERAGVSALKSAGGFWAVTKTIQADASHMHKDMVRLIRASWVSSRNIFRDTTTIRRDNDGFLNAAEGLDGKVPERTAQFVLQSADVATLSVRVLISVPSIPLFLLLLHAMVADIFDRGWRQFLLC